MSGFSKSPCPAIALPRDSQFPLEALPTQLGEFVIAETTTTGTSIEHSFFLALGALSVAAARRMEVLLHVGWAEPLNLFLLVSGSMNASPSALWREILRPIYQFETNEQKKWSAAREPELARLAVLGRRLRASLKLSGYYGTAGEAAERIRRVKDEITDLKTSAMPQLIAEAGMAPGSLGQALAQQGNRLAVVDESGRFLESLARLSSRQMEKIQQELLKAHSGRDGADKFVEGREGSTPALSLIITATPETIDHLRARHPASSSTLLSKFLILESDETGSCPGECPSVIYEDYRARLRGLLQIPIQNVAHYVTLDPAAEDLFFAYTKYLSGRLASGGDLFGLRGWAQHASQKVARMAGLLHAWIYAKGEPWRHSIEANTISVAIQIVEHFIIHARSFFGSALDPDDEAAQLLLHDIQRRELKSFSQHDLHQIVRGQRRFHKAKSLEGPLRVLVQHGHLLPEPQSNAKRPGRPPSPAFRLAEPVSRRRTSGTENSLICSSHVQVCAARSAASEQLLL